MQRILDSGHLDGNTHFPTLSILLSATILDERFALLSTVDSIVATIRRTLTGVSGFAVPFIGRLRLRSPYKDWNIRVKMEGQYAGFEVLEIPPEPFTGRAFPGYAEINLSFDEMETLVRNICMD